MSAQAQPNQGELIAFPLAPQSRPSRGTRRQRPPEEAPATTPEGDDARAIIADWVLWMSEGIEQPFPSNTRGRIGSHVRTLIVDGFSSRQIKLGLAAWTIEALGDPRLSPAVLERYVMQWTTRTPQAQRWREEINTQLQRLQTARHDGSTTVPSSATRRRDERDSFNAAARAAYRRPQDEQEEQA